MSWTLYDKIVNVGLDAAFWAALVAAFALGLYFATDRHRVRGDRPAPREIVQASCVGPVRPGIVYDWEQDC